MTTEIPWNDAGVYVYSHRIAWYLPTEEATGWREILRTLGCEFRHKKDGTWSTVLRVLPRELRKGEHYLTLRAHNHMATDEDGESVHLSIELTPIPDSSPPTAFLEETSRAFSIERVLMRLASEHPGNREGPTEANSRLMLFLQRKVWEEKYCALGFALNPIQHRGIVFTPSLVEWAISSSTTLSKLTTAPATPDLFIVALDAKINAPLGESVFERAYHQNWSELCQLMEPTVT